MKKLERIYDEVLDVKLRLMRLSNNYDLMSHERLFCHQSRHHLENVLNYLEDRIDLNKKEIHDKHLRATSASN